MEVLLTKIRDSKRVHKEDSHTYYLYCSIYGSSLKPNNDDYLLLREWSKAKHINAL